MLTSKKLLPALALASLLASGVANAVPHPQPGQTGSIDFQSVVRSLDDCTSIELTANGASARASTAEPAR